MWSSWQTEKWQRKSSTWVNLPQCHFVQCHPTWLNLELPSCEAVTNCLSYGTALFSQLFLHYSIMLYNPLCYVPSNEMRGRWTGNSCNLFVGTKMSFIWKNWGKKKPELAVQILTWFLQNTSLSWKSNSSCTLPQWSGMGSLDNALQVDPHGHTAATRCLKPLGQLFCY
jgi:hypothetical protein